MSTVTNTQASMFTNIPQQISRTWETIPISADSGSPVHAVSSRHEHSLIQKIQVDVVFSKLLGDAEEILTNESDDRCDKIIAWKEARQDWASIELAISTEIEKIINRAMTRARTVNMHTIDALKKRETTYKDSRTNNQPYDDSPSISLGSTRIAMRPPPSTMYNPFQYYAPSNVSDMIDPNESASRINAPSVVKAPRRDDHEFNDRIARLETLIEHTILSLPANEKHRHKKQSKNDGTQLSFVRRRTH